MAGEDTHRTFRILSVIAATLISLACGTNYAYSAWAPQFARRMQLSATQSNLIGNFGNFGMYASGIPVGLLVDSKGPRPAIAIGGLALGAGYFPIHRTYDNGPGSMSVTLLCFFSFLTGLGSCSAFSACIKTSASNWQRHRGTATAFPLAAFGLSAFFFTSVSGLFFPEDTSDFLLFLSIGTVTLVAVSFLFIRIVPHLHPPYTAVSTFEERAGLGPRRDSNQMTRPKPRPKDYGASSIDLEPGKNFILIIENADETSSLMSKDSGGPGDISPDDEARHHEDLRLHRLDITGMALLSRPEFWQLFVMLGLLTGVGLMTINNIGNDAHALWSHYDDSVDQRFILARQLLHVSTISFFSFTGRLLSGIFSDVLVKKHHMSRFWCLVASASIFTIAQVCAMSIENPHSLWAVSSLTGLAYGALFGVYPALVADSFGVPGLSLNWGFMTLSPVISGNIFNLAYGSIYDKHSVINRDGERECSDGLECYRKAYWVTFAASVIGILVSLWSIKHERDMKRKARQELEDHRA
ncbi:MFS general substrate transporter [Patellaria atrata CBS 101060]|uniref:MFS general substrate transporter n=1 Tax=Patellaria atrata CBS 101060 TaxID=1346257 RepID=A0A9P4S8N2_9PEZI|nr:MFS general substrate transporter [Patellaria atrata CBS 101060]